MVFIPPSEKKLSLETKRLLLEPVLPSHAEEMSALLSSQELYKFVPQGPPNVEKLRQTYQIWSRRISPEEDELWLNWVARWNGTKRLIGHFQVGYKGPEEVSIAYTVGIEYQRKGFAKEALQAIFAFLKGSMNAQTVKVWIDTRNIASINLVRKLNMKQIEFIKNADHFKGSDSDEYVFKIDL